MTDVPTSFGCAFRALTTLGLVIAVCFSFFLVQSVVEDMRFEQTSLTAQATIVDRRIVEQQTTDAEGHTDTVSIYYVTFRFTPDLPDGENATITLEEAASPDTYASLPIESRVTIRYLPSDPETATMGIQGPAAGLLDAWIQVVFVLFVDVVVSIAVYVAFVRPLTERLGFQRKSKRGSGGPYIIIRR